MIDRVFQVNKDITLKLEDNKTNIYIKEKQIDHCKSIFINNPQEHDELKEIDSIDELQDILIDFRIQEIVTLSPEEEFWGHCSNIQAWAENDYDTRILDSNLSFSLLKELSRINHPRAHIKLREEIVKRLKTGFFSTVKYLIVENYLDFLKDDDFSLLTEKPIHKKMNKQVLISILLRSTLDENERNKLKELESKIKFQLLIQKYEPSLHNICIEISNGHVNKLCLAELNLKKIPDVIRCFKALEVLDLTHCRLTEIPDWLAELKNLKQLNFGKNKITNLPLNFHNLKKLRNLNLNSNQFSSFPNVICELVKLRYLSINRGIEHIPSEIGNLKKLIRLGLDRNRIRALPDNIGNLGHLESLDLEWNQLESIPNTISNLKRLEFLNLMHNSLTRIPNSINQLSNLKEILLRKNPVVNLPSNLGENNTLKSISIDKTRFEELPKSTKRKIENQLRVLKL